MAEAKIKGVLKTWKADRGYGFIKPVDGGQDIFIHVSSLKKAGRRPIRGDVIYYQVGKDNQGKLKAVNATIAGVKPTKLKTGKFFTDRKWLLVGALGFLIVGIAAYLLSNEFLT
jgi:cold shock CspA family protein